MSEFADKIKSGNRRSIAKAITLIESSRPDHQHEAELLLKELLPFTGKALRLGLTGIPGVGKSTFIEVFGKMLTSKGHKVAVLAVDPSSQISGGSILGDKTRMEELARDNMAFIRPTPSNGTLGGIARYTREAMMLLEAAGFDIIIVETVGVGQSEVAVDNLVDMFILLLAPGGGDELQGIKRGIMELADLVIINKADGEFENAARIASADCENALHLMQPKNDAWTAKVLRASALSKSGFDEIWQVITSFRNIMSDSHQLAERRNQQMKSAIWSEVSELIVDKIKKHKLKKIDVLEKAVIDKKITPLAAAKELIDSILNNNIS
ncbi:MAG: methylmalonyl Co-A mutase-associated GTPase MeaB [Alphaproteobacteria bacterium]|nr:methylmalonyl Co-A mutase-associated GTPase MeaB [Alphaproteobacteria bacterium]HPF46250.1 methylmalonyl Co-A mutase-associated GTPase MeaB [Emcibacteraceae bacterium]